MTEVAFVRPSLGFAGQAAQAGASVWAYQMDWAPAGAPFGACHCLELPLIFNTIRAWEDAPMLGGTASDDASRTQVGSQMRAAWLSFARHGRPGPPTRWPTYSRQQRQTMVFAQSSGAASDPADPAVSEIHPMKGTKR
jgi:para-nitrobenzyl esterase